MLEGFSKGTALLHFQPVLLVDSTRICDWPFSLHDGGYVLSRALQQDTFQKQQQI